MGYCIRRFFSYWQSEILYKLCHQHRRYSWIIVETQVNVQMVSHLIFMTYSIYSLVCCTWLLYSLVYCTVWLVLRFGLMYSFVYLNNYVYCTVWFIVQFDLLCRFAHCSIWFIVQFDLLYSKNSLVLLYNMVYCTLC